ncbi:amidase [Streptococcus varani]|uniref:Amidase n=1 Tax=Streptococcus varani TaxID=1608583 RepID=A0A0E4H4F4_9STRE|nr:amidase [Streptococcus varani]CQR24198.1 amidase [Streptococcus varani]
MEFKDGLEMAQAVKGGQVSPLDLVEDSIAQIEKGNPTINAVVEKQYDEARKKARVFEFSDQVFAGVPLLLKDLGQNQAGRISTSGSRLFSHYRSSQTDYFVERLEKLGFIILGRTNTPEFGFKNISDASIHGAVNLPADLTRNAGGSSGGAAAAVASGMVPLAAASDGGGSIRIPASFNGLIGLKTSRGRIPVGPSSYRGWQGASVNFAITKSIRDTKALLGGMQTCQLESPFPLPVLSDTQLNAKLDRPLKIAYCLVSPIGSEVSSHAQEAVLEAVAFLKTLGHEVVELPSFPIDGIEVVKSYYLMNSVETAQMFDQIERNLGRKMTMDDMEVMTWAIYQSGQTIPAKIYSKTLQDWDAFSAQMADFHTLYDLFLTPTVADVAPLHGQFKLSSDLQHNLASMEQFSMQDQQDLIWAMFEKSLVWTPFTMFSNLTGQPSISLPTYQTKNDLPIGIQLTAAKGREDLLLVLSEQMENQGFLNIR